MRLGDVLIIVKCIIMDSYIVSITNISIMKLFIN